MARQEEGIKGKIKSFFGIKGHHEQQEVAHVKTETYILTEKIKKVGTIPCILFEFTVYLHPGYHGLL